MPARRVVFPWRRTFAALLAAAAFGPPAARAADWRVCGSDLLGAEFATAVAGFARSSDRTLALSLEGSLAAMRALEAGEADIGLLMLRPEQPPPAAGFKSLPLAYHTVAVLVPAASPLTRITLPELAGIYGAAAGGSYGRWSELGLTGEWANRAIEPEAMAAGRGLSLELFRALVLGGGALKSSVVLQDSPEELARRLAGGAAGIALAAALPDGAKGLKTLAVARTAQDIAGTLTPDNVQTGDYPLRLPVWLVVRQEARDADLDVLHFLLGDEVAAAFAHAGLVPLPERRRNELRFEIEQP